MKFYGLFECLQKPNATEQYRRLRLYMYVQVRRWQTCMSIAEAWPSHWINDCVNMILSRTSTAVAIAKGIAILGVIDRGLGRCTSKNTTVQK